MVNAGLIPATASLVFIVAAQFEHGNRRATGDHTS
jgi:hypothetical protein